MPENALFHIGVKALIIDKNRNILLVKAGKKVPKVLAQKEKFWDIPGGKMKIGEDVIEALQREVKEELQAKVEVLDLFDIAKSNFRDQKIKNLFLMLIVHRCKLRGDKKFKLSSEQSEWNWVPIDKAKGLLSAKYPKSVIEKLESLRRKQPL